VPYSEIRSGGPPKDGIRSIDAPRLASVDEADAWLEPQEPVLLVRLDQAARAYPVRILTQHEIVNDVIDGVPVSVTFCPLCNTAISFERELDGRVLDFGTTGRLRYSNLLMYDRQTESWWQQAIGEAIAGTFTGRQLTMVPTSIISWSTFKSAYPQGQVLSQDTGYRSSYGRNPYPGYDDPDRPPFLYDGPATPDVLPPVARVLGLNINGETVAYPYTEMEAARAVNDEVEGRPTAVFWSPGTASALDAGTVAGGRDVGAATAYSRELDGRTLSFRLEGDRIVDEGTGSEWDILGRATAGSLEGSQLTPVVGNNFFWFAWAAFHPDTRVYGASP
jgi:hypothetical protein